MKNKSYTGAVAAAAMMTALCVVILFLGSIITVLDLSSAALASLVIILAVIELGGAYPWLIYLAASLVSFLILPDKFSSLVFFVFAGYYPIVKKHIEKLPRLWQWVLKFAVCNAALTVILAVSKFILGIAESELNFSVAAYILTNITFFIYDIALTRLISLYLFKLRNKLKLFKH